MGANCEAYRIELYNDFNKAVDNIAKNSIYCDDPLHLLSCIAGHKNKKDPAKPTKAPKKEIDPEPINGDEDKDTKNTKDVLSATATDTITKSTKKSGSTPTDGSVGAHIADQNKEYEAFVGIMESNAHIRD